MEQVLDITSPAEIDDPLLFIRHGVILPQSEGTQKESPTPKLPLFCTEMGPPTIPVFFHPETRIPPYPQSPCCKLEASWTQL